MAVPKFDKFLTCILKVLGDGKTYRLKEVAAKCADALKISEEDRKVLLPSKRQTVLANRVAWAKTYLKKAGLVDSPQHGFVVLTEAGKGVLADDPDKVTVSYLETIPSFHEFHAMANTNSIMARLSRQKSDDFIVNQAAAFAASSNMTGKYASAGGMSPIAEWQRS